MDAVLTLALPFFGLILLGYLAAKWFGTKSGSPDWLTIFVVYFTVPALLYTLLAKAPVSELGNSSFIFATTLATAIIFVISLLVSRLFYGADISRSGMHAATAAYSNCGYMGVPLAVGALGAKASIPATLIVCFDSVFIFIMVPIVTALGHPERQGIASVVRDITQRILLNPLIVGCIAGALAAWFRFTPPMPIARILDYLSTAAAPCALFALGVAVAGHPLKSVPRGVSAMITFKLLLHPLVVFATLMAFGITGVWMHTAVLVASLPTALGVYVIARQYEIETHSVSSTILLSTVISVVTVTALLYAIELNLLPG